MLTSMWAHQSSKISIKQNESHIAGHVDVSGPRSCSSAPVLALTVYRSIHADDFNEAFHKASECKFSGGQHGRVPPDQSGFY